MPTTTARGSTSIEVNYEFHGMNNRCSNNMKENRCRSSQIKLNANRGVTCRLLPILLTLLKVDPACGFLHIARHHHHHPNATASTTAAPGATTANANGTDVLDKLVSAVMAADPNVSRTKRSEDHIMDRKSEWTSSTTTTSQSTSATASTFSTKSSVSTSEQATQQSTKRSLSTMLSSPLASDTSSTSATSLLSAASSSTTHTSIAQTDTMMEFSKVLQTCRNITGEHETIQDVVFAKRLGSLALETADHCQLGFHDDMSSLTFKHEITCGGNTSLLTLVLGVYPDIHLTCLSIVLGSLEILPGSPGLIMKAVCFDKNNTTQVTQQELLCNYTKHFSSFSFKPNLDTSLGAAEAGKGNEKSISCSNGTSCSSAENMSCGSACASAECHFSWSSFMFGLVLGITVVTTIAVIARRRARSFPSTSYKLSEFEGSELTLTADDPSFSSSGHAYTTTAASQPKLMKRSEIL